MTERRLGISKEMEDEIFGLCGTMLGTLEVLADDFDEQSERQRSSIVEAMRCAAMLRERVEAVTVLSRYDLETRLALVPYSVRKLVMHATRGASYRLAAFGVDVEVPGGDAWGAQLPSLDVSRVDRMLGSMTELLGSTLGDGGRVEVRVGVDPALARIELRGHPGAEPSDFDPPQLIRGAWERVLELHQGRLWLDASAYGLALELPVRTS